MRILVTGINGFVGTYLKKELETRNHEVFGLDITSTTANTFAVDIMDRKAVEQVVEQIAPEFVIHLAGIANVDHPIKSKVYDINFIGTLNLLGACVMLKNMPRFVFISSAQVYGNVPAERQPIDES